MAFQDDYVSPLRVVSAFDPALDVEAMSLRGYVQTRDPDSVRMTPGRQARWFVLRPLWPTDRVSIDAMGSSESKVLRALLLSLERVEMPDRNVNLEPTGDEIPGRAGRMWTESERNELMKLFGMKVLYEIGSVAYARSDWGNGWARGAGSYPAPRDVSDEVERTERQRAASTPPSAAAES